MTIVLIEGIDGVGKTTLINQLKEKYPDKIDTFSFPTEAAREELCNIHNGKYTNQQNVPYTTIDLILKAIIYEIDFLNNTDFIQSYLEYGNQNYNKTLLLDRWYLSNLAYVKYLFPNPLLYPHFYKNFYKIIERQERRLEPTFTVLLQSEKPIIKSDSTLPDTHLLKIQENYIKELQNQQKKWGGLLVGMDSITDKKYSIVEGLTPNTFTIVEYALKERGFLD
jgi:thymidylate kinase